MRGKVKEDTDKLGKVRYISSKLSPIFATNQTETFEQTLKRERNKIKPEEFE